MKRLKVFFFKSVDGLLGQEPKLKLIYNETPDVNGNIPEGYDQKILDFKKDNDTNVQKKLQMGAFSTRTVLFDPFTCYYEVKAPNVSEKGVENSLTLGGKDLYLGTKFRNKEFDQKEQTKSSQGQPTLYSTKELLHLEPLINNLKSQEKRTLSMVKLQTSLS